MLKHSVYNNTAETFFCHSVECNTRKEAVHVFGLCLITYSYVNRCMLMLWNAGYIDVIITTMANIAKQKTKCSFKEGDWFYKMQNREFT